MFRFVVCSLNLWNNRHWDKRQQALRKFLHGSMPDVLALQELRPTTRAAIDHMLVEYQRVDDDFPGWSHEGNIFWNQEIFSLKEYGAEDFGAVEKYSRLYWVKLVLTSGTEILFATAHFTAGNKIDEKKTGLNPRLSEATRCAEHLNRLTTEKQRVVFMGDLNEDEHTLWRLSAGGFTDVCTALHRTPQPTGPAVPLAGKIPAVDDWIYFRGPIRPMNFEVARCQADPFPPSSHWPVLATFNIK
ncbi:MAG: endonuclease [Spirochaetales bacterium]|nr:endonuclease [Spirochaetales bacterium]